MELATEKQNQNRAVGAVFSHKRLIPLESNRAAGAVF